MTTNTVVRAIIPAQPGWHAAKLTGTFGRIEDAAFKHYPIIAWDVQCQETQMEGRQFPFSDHYAIPVLASIESTVYLDRNDFGISWVFRCPNGKYHAEDEIYDSEIEALRDLYIRTQKRRSDGEVGEEAEHAAKLLSAATATKNRRIHEAGTSPAEAGYEAPLHIVPPTSTDHPPAA